MKVLHLLASPVFTGPAELVVQLALAQRALGDEVSIAVDRRRTTHSSEELLVPVLRAQELLDDQGLECSVKSSPLAWWRDLERLGARQVDVVHCHFSHDHLLARLAKPTGAALVRSIHAPRSLRWSTPRAHGWTVPFEALLRPLIGQPVCVLPALVAPEFVPADRSSRRRELGLPVGPLIGMVSTFQPSRRHALALEAFAEVARRHPEASLVLIGDGRLESAIREDVAARGLGARVHLCGYQSGARFVQHLQALDEVWLLGLGNDFSARAAAQARACGVRIVAVDEGALAHYADEVIAPDAVSLTQAALRGVRREVPLEAPSQVARRLRELYVAARREVPV